MVRNGKNVETLNIYFAHSSPPANHTPIGGMERGNNSDDVLTTGEDAVTGNIVLH